ncbi:MAG: long-chain-fatty-acid--CoA ligase [Caulobacteraceae bacterium]
MKGLMQDWPLTVDKILEHARDWHANREVVSRSVEGPIVRSNYGEIFDRAKQVSNVLLGMGIRTGDRVATLAWNSGRHMEVWYGVMGIGAVCHTLNPRLFPDQIAWIVNHAEDRIIFADITFAPIIEELIAKCPKLERVVFMTDKANMPSLTPKGPAFSSYRGVACYEDLIKGAPTACTWGGFDENTAAGLCYTSGTTGNPKGVLYSHRSNFLHTFMTLQADVLGLSVMDTILPVVPMFHANAWGIAFSAPAVGARLVMPGPKMDGESIYELLTTERVTFSAAVPTVWQMLLAHLKDNNLQLPDLKRVVIGGSACPESIIRAFHDDYGVEVTHAWGMTETSPLGTQATPTPEIAALPYDEQMAYKLKQGRAPMGVQLKLTDDEGNILPHDGERFGRLKISGPIVAGAYFKGDGGDILDEEGYFDTGDVATIDPVGFMQITDRAKDVIKSGGEWISSIEIENIAAGHPKAALAAVIGVAHPKWDERPLLLVKLKDGVTATKEEFIEYLTGKIAKWWMPDDVVFVDDIPLGATGKIDKKLIRQRMADYVLPTAQAGAPSAPATPAPAAPVALAAARDATLYSVVEDTEEPEDEAAAVEDDPIAPGASVQVAEALAGGGAAAAARLIIPEPEEAVEAAPEEAPALPVAANDPAPVESAAEPQAAPETPPEAIAPEAAAPEAAAPEVVAPEAAAPVAAEPGAAAAATEAPLTLDPKPAPPPPGERPPSTVATGFLNVTLGVAATPIALALIGAGGHAAGLWDHHIGYDVLIQDWARKFAMAGFVTGGLGFLMAVIGGFKQLWFKAVIALFLTVATTAGLGMANTATNPPIDPSDIPQVERPAP